MKRRELLKGLALSGAALSTPLPTMAQDRRSTGRPSLSINAYSFNKELRSGEMTFVDMMDFAVALGLDAVDVTGYYFDSYPNPPSDPLIYDLKREALSRGLAIPWTGIRTDFVTDDERTRQESEELVRQWMAVSQKIGASMMRIFPGTGSYADRDAAFDRLVKHLRRSGELGEQYGVMAALQHHNDFLYTADEVLEVLDRVDHDWLGLLLDIGSLDAPDPYAEIAKLAPRASYWFIKEHVKRSNSSEAVNMKEIASILRDQAYIGYVSFESVAGGDAKRTLQRMVTEFRKTL